MCSYATFGNVRLAPTISALHSVTQSCFLVTKSPYRVGENRLRKRVHIVETTSKSHSCAPPHRGDLNLCFMKTAAIHHSTYWCSSKVNSSRAIHTFSHGKNPSLNRQRYVLDRENLSAKIIGRPERLMRLIWMPASRELAHNCVHFIADHQNRYLIVTMHTTEGSPEPLSLCKANKTGRPTVARPWHSIPA